MLSCNSNFVLIRQTSINESEIVMQQKQKNYIKNKTQEKLFLLNSSQENWKKINCIIKNNFIEINFTIAKTEREKIKFYK